MLIIVECFLRDSGFTSRALLKVEAPKVSLKPVRSIAGRQAALLAMD